MGLITNIKRILARSHGGGVADAQTLRLDFQARYHEFKLLLAANNAALEIMTEMGEALKGTQPFGMNFVRSSCTQVSAHVFNMVRHLTTLAPGRYEALHHRFSAIGEKVNTVLHHQAHQSDGPLVLDLAGVDASMADLVGGKIANLGELAGAMGLKIPEGFVVTSAGYRLFMEGNSLQEEIDRRVQSANARNLDEMERLSSSIQQLVLEAKIPEDLKQTMEQQLDRLDRKGSPALALRSSALGEDFAETSFAGQYRSALNVPRAGVYEAYKEVVSSKWGVTAMTYRHNRGIPDEDVDMSVGCMAMIDAASGGVLYTRNPVDPRARSLVINSVFGLPKPVVDGSMDADLFVMNRSNPPRLLQQEIADKPQRYQCLPEEGICRLQAEKEQASSPSLTEEQAVDLARIGLAVEEHYGRAMDVEWALSREGSPVLLQCRPLRTFSASPRMDEKTPGTSGTVLAQGGVTASPGAACGPVHKVEQAAQALSFPQGAILILSQSLPRWAPLLGRASAVITEFGGITGHLANVSREFGVPALFGVPGAMEKLKNGEEVTVDADAGRVYRGRVDNLLTRVPPPVNLMGGSPVYSALQEAAALITPLRLLDPESPAFRAENCTTFHDITRFCHEKAVHEMFRFGKRHRFPERSSKQLVAKVPMQWWVLNLDDGFMEEVEGRYVQLDNIASIPMLAVWKGISAVPWQGPPAIDSKGLLSVMFHSTMNQALVPGMRSKYSDRNYFMISKNFLSLHSRFGYHFCQLEALVGERDRENYATFQFKGGAADDERRRLRVEFLRRILEERGFRVEVTDDRLAARLEKRDQAFMEDSLRVLGYLLIHTRQLDMVMRNQAQVRRYRDKFKEDIDVLLSGEGNPHPAAENGG